MRSRCFRRIRLLVAGAFALGWAPTAFAADGGHTDPFGGMEMILVRGGSFRMGDFTGRGLAIERPSHPVVVSDFFLGRHEVTVAQFRAFVEATGYRTDAERAGGVVDIDPVMKALVKRAGISWSAPGFAQDDRNPVVWVTWNDATEYALWLARATGKPFRLPTEAEWEFAARERGRDLPWSGTADPGRAGDFAWTAENSGGAPHPVEGKEPNALGFHDLTGNVWEWCLDAQSRYRETAEPEVDPRGPAGGDFRMLRGGSWRVTRDVARTTYRNGYRTDYPHSSIGLRVALEADARI